MKVWKQALTGLLAGLLLLSSACTPPEAPPVETPPEPPAEEENTIPGAEEPGLPENPSMEQAGLVDSNLMLYRLEDNLLEPIAASLRLSQQDSSTLTQLTPALLEELAGFLCQNYTVLRETARVDLRGAIYMEIFGEKESHELYIQQWIDGEGKELTFLQVEENGIMGQYTYDPTTYDAIVEVLEGWQYENKVIVNGPYLPLTVQDYQNDLKSGRYDMNYFLQFEDKLLLGLSSRSSSHGYFEIIDPALGQSVQTIELDKPVVDVRRTDLDGYDFYIMTADSIHVRSCTDPGLKLDFTIPQTVKDRLLNLKKYPLFDLDYINDELVYATEEGIILSNQSGKRNDMVLRNEDLYPLLNLDHEEDEAVQETVTPLYVSPQLMNNGRFIVCPILLRGEVDSWVGFSIFNLMNGTSKNYVTEFNHLTGIDYPNDTTITLYGSKAIYQMDVLTREISSQTWDCEVYDRPFFRGLSSMLLWRRTMDYGHQLLLQPLGEESTSLTTLLTIEGDRVQVYGMTEGYALLGWSDAEGDVMAVVKCPA